MYKVKIFLNGSELFDEDVCVEAKLPFIPREGDYLRISSDEYEILNKKMRKNIEIAMRYCDEFYGGKKDIDKITKKDLKDFDCDDCLFVYRIDVSTESEYVFITLSYHGMPETEQMIRKIYDIVKR